MQSLQDREFPSTLDLPTRAENEEMRRLGLIPGAIGYDEHNNLVRRLADGGLELIEGSDD